jgi:cAMP phosphodiesterase
MYHLFRQDKFLNMPLYIPKSDEIDWELLILDENDRQLTKEVYENINNIENYRLTHPNIPDNIYKKAMSISKCGVQNKYLKYEKPSIIDELFKSEDMTSITFVACGLLFFYGKILLEYLQEKIDI